MTDLNNTVLELTVDELDALTAAKSRTCGAQSVRFGVS